MIDRLTDHCAQLPRTVLFDPEAGQLMDLGSGKILPIPQLEAVESQADPRTGAPLLGVRLKSGRAFVLAQLGIAFAPVFTHTGPLEELPAAVGWSDLRTLLVQLKLELYGAAAPSEATVRVLMGCLAIVDGARAIGFDVGPEEHELEWHLKELERRAPG